MASNSLKQTMKMLASTTGLSCPVSAHNHYRAHVCAGEFCSAADMEDNNGGASLYTNLALASAEAKRCGAVLNANVETSGVYLMYELGVGFDERFDCPRDAGRLVGECYLEDQTIVTAGHVLRVFAERRERGNQGGVALVNAVGGRDWYKLNSDFVLWPVVKDKERDLVYIVNQGEWFPSTQTVEVPAALEGPCWFTGRVENAVKMMSGMVKTTGMGVLTVEYGRQHDDAGEVIVPLSGGSVYQIRGRGGVSRVGVVMATITKPEEVDVMMAAIPAYSVKLYDTLRAGFFGADERVNRTYAVAMPRSGTTVKAMRMNAWGIHRYVDSSDEKYLTAWIYRGEGPNIEMKMGDAERERWVERREKLRGVNLKWRSAQTRPKALSVWKRNRMGEWYETEETYQITDYIEREYEPMTEVDTQWELDEMDARGAVEEFELNEYDQRATNLGYEVEGDYPAEEEEREEEREEYEDADDEDDDAFFAREAERRMSLNLLARQGLYVMTNSRGRVYVRRARDGDDDMREEDATEMNPELFTERLMLLMSGEIGVTATRIHFARNTHAVPLAGRVEMMVREDESGVEDWSTADRLVGANNKEYEDTPSGTWVIPPSYRGREVAYDLWDRFEELAKRQYIEMNEHNGVPEGYAPELGEGNVDYAAWGTRREPESPAVRVKGRKSMSRYAKFGGTLDFGMAALDVVKTRLVDDVFALNRELLNCSVLKQDSLAMYVSGSLTEPIEPMWVDCDTVDSVIDTVGVYTRQIKKYRTEMSAKINKIGRVEQKLIKDVRQNAKTMEDFCRRHESLFEDGKPRSGVVLSESRMLAKRAKIHVIMKRSDDDGPFDEIGTLKVRTDRQYQKTTEPLKRAREVHPGIAEYKFYSENPVSVRTAIENAFSRVDKNYVEAENTAKAREDYLDNVVESLGLMENDFDKIMRNPKYAYYKMMAAALSANMDASPGLLYKNQATTKRDVMRNPELTRSLMLHTLEVLHFWTTNLIFGMSRMEIGSAIENGVYAPIQVLIKDCATKAKKIDSGMPRTVMNVDYARYILDTMLNGAVNKRLYENNYLLGTEFKMGHTTQRIAELGATIAGWRRSGYKVVSTDISGFESSITGSCQMAVAKHIYIGMKQPYPGANRECELGGGSDDEMSFQMIQLNLAAMEVKKLLCADNVLLYQRGEGYQCSGGVKTTVINTLERKFVSYMVGDEDSRNISDDAVSALRSDVKIDEYLERYKLVGMKAKDVVDDANVAVFCSATIGMDGWHMNSAVKAMADMLISPEATSPALRSVYKELYGSSPDYAEMAALYTRVNGGDL